jgi:4'-phosphopantetheinyl transferase
MTQSLNKDEIAVWWTLCNSHNVRIERLYSYLSEDERNRAMKLKFNVDRHQFVVSRAVLRELLSAYLGVPPQKITLGYNNLGKPEIVDPPSKINFSVSHSHNLIVYGFASNLSIGVDVERVAPDFPAMDIAKSSFSEEEFNALTKIRQPALQCAFFSCWTLKEAYLKATGHGLSRRLNDFSVSFSWDRPTLQSDKMEGSAPQRWSLKLLKLAEGYAGAIAYESRVATVVIREYCAPLQ